MKFLLANSDQDFIDNFIYSFKTEDYHITSAKTIADTIDFLKKDRFDMAIIDMKFKDGTGLDLKRKMNEVINIPTIVVSESKEPNEVVLALEYGCDDYIVRPFYLLELKARIRSVLRRANQYNEENGGLDGEGIDIISKGRFKFNVLGRNVKVDSTNIELTGKEFDLLYVLVNNRKKIFSRQDLADQLWHGIGESNIRTVDVHIRRLRGKLLPTGTDKFIQTSWGEGYYFDDEVTK